jgi:hypothetical protein
MPCFWPEVCGLPVISRFLVVFLGPAVTSELKLEFHVELLLMHECRCLHPNAAFRGKGKKGKFVASFN